MIVIIMTITIRITTMITTIVIVVTIVIMSCPFRAAMMTAVALLSCGKKRKFCTFHRSQLEPPEAAAHFRFPV